MTYLRKLLSETGVLKLAKGESKTRPTSHKFRTDRAAEGKTIRPISTSRLELEIEKLLAPCRGGGSLAEGLPCNDITELGTSSPAMLSFGMFQNVVFIVSVLCVKSSSTDSDDPISEDKCFEMVLQRIFEVVQNEKQLPFPPFPPEFRNLGGGGYVIPNNLPSPFQHESVMDVYLQERGSLLSQNLGVWRANLESVSFSVGPRLLVIVIM
jgi:hypothetical protein